MSSITIKKETTIRLSFVAETEPGYTAEDDPGYDFFVSSKPDMVYQPKDVSIEQYYWLFHPGDKSMPSKVLLHADHGHGYYEIAVLWRGVLGDVDYECSEITMECFLDIKTALDLEYVRLF